jgi:putative membrane-bound dehydrogenase-like protein
MALVWNARVALAAVLLLLLLSSPPAAAEDAFPVGKVDPAAMPSAPPGFTVTVFAKEPVVRNPCAMAFDARGRLFVGMGPQYRNPKPDTPPDSVVILEDHDNDGVADGHKVFATGLNCVQGLAWRGRDLWIANAPDLTIARDTDGDDVADQYVRVYTDLGNVEHGLHGLTFAPDGMLYMSKGNSKGLNTPDRYAPKALRDLWGLPAPAGAVDLPPPVTYAKGAYRAAYHDPRDDWGRTGGILRCDHAGGRLEVVARGLRNPWDLALDSGFNWLGTDNDQTGGDRQFMPFLGADFGWGHRWSSGWTGRDHPPTPPITGPVYEGSGTGITYYDAPQFPPEFRRAYFWNDWLRKTTFVYRPKWDGAVLAHDGAWEPFVKGGLALYRPVDVETGPDGALWVTGWGASYGATWSKDGQQANEGRVFRIAWGAAPPATADPNRTRPLPDRTFAELAADLGSHLPVWRVDAQAEILRRGPAARADLLALLGRPDLSEATQTWALWTLGRLATEDPAADTYFAGLATRKSAALNARVQAIRILAHRAWDVSQIKGTRDGARAATAIPPAVVSAGLTDPEPRVRFETVQALRRANQSSAVDALRDLAATETDRVTYYATWGAARDLATADELRAWLADTRPGVRRAAVLALADLGKLTPADAARFAADPATADVVALYQGRPAPGADGDAQSRPGPSTPPAGRPSSTLVTRVEGAMRPAVAAAGIRLGDRVYTDRPFTVTALPPELVGATWIRTANAAAGVGGDAALRLDSLLPVHAYVAHDDRVAAKPAWLRAGWERTAHSLRTTDASLTLFKRRFDAGSITLGGNADDGTDRGKSSYVVLLTPALAPPARPTTADQVIAALPAGDAARGRALFFAPGAAGCASCHRAGDDGGVPFGPDLTHLRDRNDPQSLVRAILEPSAILTEGFATQTVTLRDGETHTGIFRDETDRHLTLTLPGGEPLRLAKADVRGRESSAVSAMPPYGTVLTAAQVADLVAFLVAPRPAPPSTAPAARATAATRAPATTTSTTTAPVSPPAAAGKGFAADAKPDRLVITHDGRPVAEYVFADPKTLRPHFRNVHAPGGERLTRTHPPVPGKDADDHATMHPGLWLAFGDVNGEDFWRNKGRIEHARFAKPSAVSRDEGGDGSALTFTDESRLVTAAGDPLATLASSYRLTRTPHGFLLAWDAELRADRDRDLVFGDQEEMGLGARLATPLTEKAGGRVLTADGVTGAAAAWGKQSAWCDYAGKLGDAHAGIAIVPDPRNPHPCWWHTRDYGVFVANPFGPRAGVPGGRLTVRKGDALRLRFHVLIHAGATPPDLAAVARELPR